MGEKLEKQGAKWVLIAFMLAHAANDGFNALFPPLLPLIREYFNLSYARLGGFLSLFRIFGSYLQVPAGYLSQFISSSTLLVSGLLWLSAGVLLASFAKSYWVMAGSLSLAGIGRATYHPLSFSLLSKSFPKEVLGKIIGIHMTASSVAHLVCPLLVILLAKQYGWYWPIRVWAIYGTGAALMLLLVMRKNMAGEVKAKEKALRLPFVSSSLVLFVLFRMGWGIARNGMNVFLPLFLVENAHFSIQYATAYYMSQYVIELFTRPLAGSLSDKIGKRKPVMIVESILCCLLFIGLTIFKTKPALLLIVLAMGLFAGTLPVVGQTYVIEMIPAEHRERTLGFVFTLNTAATTFSPLILGFIADYFGLLQSFVILTAIIAFSIILLFFTRENQ